MDRPRLGHVHGMEFKYIFRRFQSLLGCTAPICTRRQHAIVDHFLDADLLSSDIRPQNIFAWNHQEIGMRVWSRRRWMFLVPGEFTVPEGLIFVL
jgi:hypothetical protein